MYPYEWATAYGMLLGSIASAVSNTVGSVKHRAPFASVSTLYDAICLATVVLEGAYDPRLLLPRTDPPARL